MKHVVVGDLHGRIEVVDHVLYTYPEHNIIFLGDYVDSFHEPVEKQIKLVRIIMDLIDDKKAVGLFGNHELSYFYPHLECSGWKAAMSAKLLPMKHEMMKRFLPCLLIDDILFSHAGLTQPLATEHGIENIGDLADVLALWSENPYSPMYQIGVARGGPEGYGGTFWCDWTSEFVPIPWLRQVFGHSQSRRAAIKFTETVVGGLRHVGENWNIDCNEKFPHFIEFDDESKTLRAIGV